MRILEVYGILVLLLVSLAAAENVSLEDLFPSGDATIMPPSIEEALAGEPVAEDEAPEAAGALASALEAPRALDKVGDGLLTLTLNIRDIRTDQPITDAHIRVYLDDGQQQAGTLRFVGGDGRMILQLPPATWSVTLKLDLTDTPGKDYYSRFETMLTGDQNLTAFMQPVGSLTGDVVDSDNNLISGAQIKFECIGDYGEVQSTVTDQFGSFSADWLPIGTCRVSALSGKTGSSSVEISHGQMSSLTISLNQGVSEPAGDYMWVLIIIVAALALLAGLALSKRGVKEPEVEVPKEIEPDGRMKDITSALDESERRILEFLMQKGGKSQQNHIGRELGFPKSSLSRAIGGLEARNLVETEKLGRIKRVELSDWFLNGRRP